MRCIYCGQSTKVTNSRSRQTKVWRRRQCTNCSRLFSTYETPDFSNLLAVLDDTGATKQSVKAFCYAKFLISIVKACDHIPTNHELHAENIASRVLVSLVRKDTGQSSIIRISRKTLAKQTAKELEKLDKISFIKYCSAHSVDMNL